jgi:two-component sensor histidine kinase/DNA-binding response OmpR family regulator
MDRLRGYEMGAVDYVPVPVIPEVLRAKVKVFIELYRKTKQLALLNRDLEERVAERTVALAASAAQLKQSEQLRSLALAAGQMGSWEWDAVHGRLAWDQGQHSIFGVDAGGFAPTPESVRALIHADDVERVASALRGLLSDPQTARIEFRARRPDGQTRWCIGVAAASRDDNDRIVRISGVTIDITDRKLAEDRQALLAEEVDHRARNVVAVIQSIMRLTHAPDIQSYLSAIDGRIRALSNAHKLLSRSRWEGADLGKLVDEEFAPYRSENAKRLLSEGPKILLLPSTAQTIALAVHELTTNAAKYGALSTGAGHVSVRWSSVPNGIRLIWEEHDGPQVVPPKSKGYGSRVLQGGIEHQLGGNVTFEWLRSGLRCTIFVPHDNKVDAKIIADARAPDVSSANGAHLNVLPGDEILLVEDEPLIAMMVSDILSELGLRVDGPHGTMSDALLAAQRGAARAAILDINIGGEKVYPVASLLNSRNIPFVFLTGYARESIDDMFRGAVTLHKPVERQELRNVLVGLSVCRESAWRPDVGRRR